MATVIQIKRTTTANLPTANNGTLEQGELAYVYDVVITNTNSNDFKTRVVEGIATVMPSVTRS